jgi:hypothetical protein
MAALGAPMGGPPPGGNPDDLLMQIRDLLDQYLALGGDTPVAPEAQALAQAIDASTGGGPDAGAAPPPDPGMDPGAMPPPDGGQAVPNDLSGMGGYGGGDFGGANAALLEDMMKKKKSKG